MLSFSVRNWRLWLPTLLLPMLGGIAHADVSLPHIYSDHMVLLQNQPLSFRGTATPGENVTVSMASTGKQTKTQWTTAGDDGTWSVSLPALKAGGPYQIIISGNNKIVLSDVLIGEVWFCSGQSNMATTLPNAKNPDAEIAAAKNPNLRVFTSNFATRATPQADLITGHWQLTTPENAREFSAVGYFFGRDLQQELKVPVGIVVSSAGGTVIESWLNQSALKADPISTPQLDEFKARVATLPAPADDKGWQASGYADTDWKTMPIPGAWETGGEGMEKLDGAVWFRREVTIPESWEGKPLTLNFSAIDDGDVTYFNGVQVGSMNVDTPLVWTVPRHYTVPASAVKAGRAVIATRITDQLGGGGFIGKPEEMWLGLADQPATRIPLDGPWKYKIAEIWPDTSLTTSLYNGMVAPWTSFPVAGVAWYQGESNAGNAANYSVSLPKLIKGWRSDWKRSDLPFMVIQLPGYGADGPNPAESDWAALREAQAKTAAEVNNVSLAVTLDLGEVNDIHPKNKQDVATRVTKLALANVYGRKIVATGPICDNIKIEGNQVRLHFKNTGKGLIVRGGELKGFAIAGADKQFVWAKATLTGDVVTVQSEQVPNPVYVRYGWANSPAVSLYNVQGFPAAPFRTENATVIPGK